MTTLDDFKSVEKAFAVEGAAMRLHKGRSVVKICVEGHPHYLKRYWLDPSQIFQRHVTRGHHELRMIDWLNNNGFAGPRIVARGASRRLAINTRLFFLMEEAADEMPLEQIWWKMPEHGDSLLTSLACFAARIHDAGFIHTDFSERHIMVGRRGEEWTFRLIDVERARVDSARDRLAAADLKTLAASIDDQKLRNRIGTDFLADYAAKRKTLQARIDMHSLFAAASATRSF